MVLRQLESLAEVSPHFFWLFAEPFADAKHYAGSIAEAFRARVARLNEKLAAKGKEWPPLPELAFDDGQREAAVLELHRKRFTGHSAAEAHDVELVQHRFSVRMSCKLRATISAGAPFRARPCLPWS